jgi:nicotinamidase-related amidase
MSELKLPVRFTSNDGVNHTFDTLLLPPKKSALLLVDCNGDCGPLCNKVIEDMIAPVLQAARLIGVKPIFIYGDGWLPDGANSRAGEYHKTRRGFPPDIESWRPSQPIWTDSIKPLESEPLIAKKAQNAFVATFLDLYLRSHDIETLFLVGFSFKSCLFYTTVGAFERNYRVVFLRDGTDPPGTNEFTDTIDPNLAEGGWVRTILTRLIEDHLGYSSTCKEFVKACSRSSRGKARIHSNSST